MLPAYNANREGHVTKPQGYRHSAYEECFGLFVLSLPYYQTLFLVGTTGLISAIALACLLLFVIESSPAVYRTIAQSLRSLPLSWVPPPFAGHRTPISKFSVCPFQTPGLAPSFQRPPPLLFA
jgi:hypothetical protein